MFVNLNKIKYRMLERDYEKRNDAEEILAELNVRNIFLLIKKYFTIYFIKDGSQKLTLEKLQRRWRFCSVTVTVPSPSCP